MKLEFSRDYIEMDSNWQMVSDLLGGTRSMRSAGGRWLPIEEREQDKAWRNRLDRSILYNALRDTVEKLTAKPYSKTVTVRGEIPDWFDSGDVDGQGTNITTFSKQMFETAVSYGLTHVLIDFPMGPSETAEDDVGKKPLWRHIDPRRLIRWDYVEVNGVIKLTRIVIREFKTIDNERIEFHRHIMSDGTWEVYRIKDNEMSLDDSGTHTFNGIPLATFYVKKEGFLKAGVPLEDLAWLNIAHWQSYSDQRNILRYVRCGIILATGFSEGDLDEVVIGPNTFVQTSDTEADLKFVEHTGKGMEAGAKDLATLEERMEVLGLQPLIMRTSSSTATGMVLDAAKTQSSIQAWIRGQEETLRLCIDISAKWMNATVSEDAAFDIWSEFGIPMKAEADINQLLKIRSAREISHETFLNEIKRRALLSDLVDVDEEIARLEMELPVLPPEEIDAGEQEDF